MVGLQIANLLPSGLGGGAREVQARRTIQVEEAVSNYRSVSGKIQSIKALVKPTFYTRGGVKHEPHKKRGDVEGKQIVVGGTLLEGKQRCGGRGKEWRGESFDDACSYKADTLDRPQAPSHQHET